MGETTIMKRLVFILLGLAMTIGGVLGQSTISTVRVSTSLTGPTFLVDGTPYTTPQVFLWPSGSKHIIQFPLGTAPDGTNLPYQANPDDSVRYTFGSWQDNTGHLMQGNNPFQTVVASPDLTSLTANLTMVVRLKILLGNPQPTKVLCDDTNGTQNPLNFGGGVVFFQGSCLASDTTTYVTPGPFMATAFPFPGWAFLGWAVNAPLPNPNLLTFTVNGPTFVQAYFTIAKRVKFTTSPPGLKVLVDSGVILTSTDSTTCVPDYTRFPVTSLPAAFIPCAGSFDFVPSSTHTIGAPSPQSDLNGKSWVFTGWSNGLGQNALYKADNLTNTGDSLTANFVPGISVTVNTVPSRLRVMVDGRNDWPAFAFTWGLGTTHQISAPASQVDSAGRTYNFKSWSNSGTAAQTITVDPSADHLALVATYQAVPQVILQTAPSNQTIQVDGTSCMSPCVLDRASGSQANVVLPGSVKLGDLSRLDFTGWSDGSTATTRTVTFNTDQQILTANYQTSFLLIANSNPPSGVDYTFSPPSPDGFFPVNTQVTVTAKPKGGFKFLRWDGDLSGSFPSGVLTMSTPRLITSILDRVPFIQAAGVKNAAGDTPVNAVAPGSIIAIFGQSLASDTVVGPTSPLAQTLADVIVTIGDRILPLLFVSPTQINAQIFSDLSDGDYTLKVQWQGHPAVTAPFTVARNAPGLFTWTDSNGTTYSVATHADGSLVTQDNPARHGEEVTIYGTGFGPFDRKVIDGFLTPVDPPVNLVDPVQVVTGNAQLQPDWTGAAPGFVGTAITKVKITDSVTQSGTVPVSVMVNGKPSNVVMLPVQ